MQFYCGGLFLGLFLIPMAVSSNNYNKTAIVESVKETVIEIFKDFQTITPVVNFVRSVDDEQIDFMIDEILEKVMKHCGESMSFRLQTFDKMTKGRRRKKEFCVFFVDSYKGFRKIFERMTFEMFDFQGYYTIINIPCNISNSTEDIQLVFNDLWKHYMINSIYLQPSFLDPLSINIFTSFPFTTTHCEHVHPILYNTFNASFKFLHSDRPHFANKVANFHQCPLKISTLEIAPFSTCKEKDGKWISWGIDGIFTSVVGKELNSSYDRIFTHKSSWKNTSSKNPTTLAIEMVIDGKVNFSIGFMTESRKRNLKMASSYSYYTTNLVWVISAEKPLTPLQIFSKPFQKEVWSCMVLVLFVSFAVIFCVNRMSLKVQNFVFGRKIQHRGLNMINILLGGAMVRLPGRNFARFLITIFTLYALVLRHGYQGALYQFMRMENETQDIKRIDDLLARNFSFYSLDILTEYLKSFPRIYNQTTSLNLEEFENFRFQLLDPKNNFALLASEDHVSYWNKLYYPHIFFNTCPERVSSINLCIYFPKNSCLIKEINKKIFEMTDNGFLHVFIIQTIDKAYLKKKKMSQEPKKLNLQQLSGGCHLYFIGIVSSFIIFLIEVICGVEKWKRSTKI